VALEDALRQLRAEQLDVVTYKKRVSELLAQQRGEQ
jgi:hypothetical protein